MPVETHLRQETPLPPAPEAAPHTVTLPLRPPTGRPHIVIVGGGFAGLAAAKTLRKADVDVTVIDRTNHFTFQPLLYQVATAALSPSDITAPIRHILRTQKNAAVLMGEVSEIDVENRVVYLDADRKPVPYDFLVLATGARHSYFGHDEWEKDAPGLKGIPDALEIRSRFLHAFEEAEKAPYEADREAWMTFVIVGGGPTGCELAGVLPEIARRALRQDFRRIDTNETKVLLVEAGPRILPTFPEDLAKKAAKDLEHLGVTIKTGDPVTAITDEAVTLKSGAVIPTRTVIWAAGNAASPLAKQLKAPLDRAGRVVVEKDLSVPGRPEVFVAGDLAAFTQKNGKPVPGVAQGAMQGGAHAAKNLLRRIQGEDTVPFDYWDKGNLAVIGRNKAIADLNKVRLSGFVAWVIWLFIHILYLVGFRNRIAVLMEWAYAYLTYERGVRLIQPTEQRILGDTADAPASASQWGSGSNAQSKA